MSAVPQSLKKQLEQKDEQFMPPSAKSRPVVSASSDEPTEPLAAPPEHVVQEANFCEALKVLDETEPIDHPVFMQSLTMSIAAEHLDDLKGLDAETLESADKLQGRYIKVAESINGSAAFRQVQLDETGSEKLLLAYFNGED